MSKQCLDVFNVNTTLKQVAGKTVTAAMTGNMLGYASPGGTLFEVLIDAVLIKVSAGPGTGEKNSSGFTTLKPVFSQEVKVPVRKDRIPIPPAFALADMDGFVGARYIVIMKVDDFRHS